ncbi:hypothetical protein KAS42_02670 [bacterium]|nr:hypothetical protein [bacterium]
MKFKLLSVFLVAMMLFSVTSGIVAAAQNSSDVITASDAGGGEMTGSDIAITVLCVFGVLLLIILIA